ncbi:Crp/Fnr family transcriptional regulator [Desulfosporosinus youngiae]|uniref:cAMP-binding protein n=1 Tax=Desulfosporosinus youngiae DSM 17734 TaxID=768710 RepID=H5Y4R9_9FIRM|nr:Crp/Fnr family transcriptional regulator [Desulfosporosinus youngiae]EHQ89805.1 cAMP-binding protein [Desulfosporosinus youngiae DSM 17734]
MEFNSKLVFMEELKAAFDFARELTSDQLECLVGYATLQKVPAGTVLAEKGSDCSALALLLAGKLRISMISEDGREVTLYRIGKGRTCPLSAACIFGNYTGNTVTVTAETDSRVVFVTRDFFVKSIAECEPFYRFVFSDISNRLFQATEVVDSIAFISVKKRLAQLLLLNSNSGKYSIYMTHEAFARELGTAREVVSRELKGFERLGILSLARGRLVINNTEALERIARN